ncbi:MAG: hypothetical protein HWD58_10600 [Bacteroidota bacterium]|nr:MAG: hypothetical protein HWD58_10600 [Bacteroidota bacterium]
MISAKVTGYIAVYVSNIIVTHSSCNEVFIYNGFYGLALANIMVSKCVMNNCGIHEYSGDISKAITDVLITNNIIKTYFYMINQSSATISNNIISTNGLGNSTFRNSTLSNNILYYGIYPFQFENCTGSNNIENNTFMVGALVAATTFLMLTFQPSSKIGVHSMEIIINSILHIQTKQWVRMPGRILINQLVSPEFRLFIS